MSTFYITFGFADQVKRNKYQKITAPTYDLARHAVFGEHGNKFAFMYTEAEFKGQPERYNLTPMDKEIIA